MKMMGQLSAEEKPAFGLTDLNHYLQNLNRKISTEEENEVDTKIFHNALEFKQVKVRDCMIPRTEITAIEIEEGIEGLKKVFIESGHSKVLVYKETLEEVVGYCHSLALFKKPKEIVVKQLKEIALGLGKDFGAEGISEVSTEIINKTADNLILGKEDAFKYDLKLFDANLIKSDYTKLIKQRQSSNDRIRAHMI